MTYDLISGLACIACMVYLMGLLFNFYNVYSQSTRNIFISLTSVCFIYFLGEYVGIPLLIEQNLIQPYYGLLYFSGIALLVSHIHRLAIELRRKSLEDRIGNTKYLASLPLHTAGNATILSVNESIMHQALQNGATQTGSICIKLTQIAAWAGMVISSMTIVSHIINSM
jgi:hypothetical protein